MRHEPRTNAKRCICGTKDCRANLLAIKLKFNGDAHCIVGKESNDGAEPMMFGASGDECTKTRCRAGANAENASIEGVICTSAANRSAPQLGILTVRSNTCESAWIELKPCGAEGNDRCGTACAFGNDSFNGCFAEAIPCHEPCEG